MLHAVADEHTLAADLEQVLPDLADGRCVAEPAHLDTVQPVHASSDCRFRVDQGVEYETAVLIYN